MPTYLCNKTYNSQRENCCIFPKPVGGFSGIFPLMTKNPLQYCDREGFLNALTLTLLFLFKLTTAWKDPRKQNICAFIAKSHHWATLYIFHAEYTCSSLRCASKSQWSIIESMALRGSVSQYWVTQSCLEALTMALGYLWLKLALAHCVQMLKAGYNS